MADGPTIVLDRREGVSVITLNRPRVLNALTVPMLAELSAAIRQEGGGGGSALVLTGAGRAFSSGDDLDATDGLDRPAFEEMISAFQDVTVALADATVPVVAALNGIAVGGAAEIACACDLRVGGATSEFLFPENGLGLTISNGSTFTLPSLVGRRALGLVLLGERIAAERAFDLGLIDRMVEGDVLEGAVALAAELGSPDRATRFHLRMLRPPRDELIEALRREQQIALEAFDAGAPQSGVRAFLDRRRG
ncbi:MAG: enoyl-CoA hydratase/isomerase family protein [Actinomycetota bacterium]|nr:enoyl-CoA hydratase/isomerase family protein [Actinomycetota bacterium]